MNSNILNTFHGGIVFSILLFTFFSCSQPGEVDEGVYTPVENITILFTEHVVEMPDPYAVVSLDALTEEADSVRIIIKQFDPDATIERSFPDYIHEENGGGDRSKQYLIRFTSPIPFFDIKELLEDLDVIVWVSPPVWTHPLV
jgi:hypothetical protein